MIGYATLLRVFRADLRQNTSIPQTIDTVIRCYYE
jgi:hypothetical protein